MWALFFWYKNMHKLYCLSLFLASNFVSARALTIDESSVDFGEQYQFSEVTHDVRIWNASGDVVVLNNIRTLIGRGKASVDKRLLNPHDSAILHIDVPLERSTGVTSSRFLLETKEAQGSERYVVRVTGFVDSVLDDPNPVLDLGVVDKKEPAKENAVVLKSSEEPSLKVTKILQAPEFVDAKVADDGVTIKIKPGHLSILGINSGALKLSLSSSKQHEAWIQVAMDVHGDVVPDQNPLDFGLQRMGKRTTIRLQLNSRDGKDFRVSEPVIKDARMKAEFTDCIPIRSQGCRAVLFTVQKDQPFGQIFGAAIFDLADTKEMLSVNFSGLILDDQTPVQPLEKILKPNAPIAQSLLGTEQPLAEAIKRSITPSQEAVVPLGSGPLLKWQVGNESGIYGYAIYRSDSVDGHFVRVNDVIVKAHNEGDNVTASYQWRDISANKGNEYWYYISIFRNSGKKIQLTGPQKVTAK